MTIGEIYKKKSYSDQYWENKIMNSLSPEDQLGYKIYLQRKEQQEFLQNVLSQKNDIQKEKELEQQIEREVEKELNKAVTKALDDILGDFKIK